MFAKSSALLGIGSGFLMYFKRSPFLIRDYYVSRHLHEMTFSSTQEFWKVHYDKIGDNTNVSFLASKRLLSKRSYLLNDQKTIVVEQIFRNKTDYFLREHIKIFLKKDTPQFDPLILIKQETEFLV